MQFKNWLENNELNLSSDSLRILKILAQNKMPMSGEGIRRQLPGFEGLRMGYITVTMPVHELVKAGLVEKSGQMQMNTGVGFSYVGPGSSNPNRPEKDDPAGEIYRLTDKGHDLAAKLLGKDTRPAPKPPEEPYDAERDRISQINYLVMMISQYQAQLKQAELNKKPRLAAEAKKKLLDFQRRLKEIKK